MSLCDDLFADVTTNETGSACDQNPHDCYSFS